MRPPSYYASIVKRNNTTTSLAYGPSDYDSSRTSSQQLRSSLSSPSSSSYVQRSHLPFVPQSTLVAHCFTGVGSSTRPYGASNSTSSSSGSSSSAYSTSSSLSSLSSSRQPSTKSAYPHSSYHSSNGPSSSSSSAYLRPSSYLTPSITLASSSSSRYRPTTTTTSSSYYKPIRLRERPLLTQISRQIHSPTPPPRPTSRKEAAAAAAASEEQQIKPTVHSNESETTTTTTNSKLAPNLESDLEVGTRANEDEATWSSDIGRNISRNKYLIKFREIDKKSEPRSSEQLHTVHVEATVQLPPAESKVTIAETETVPVLIVPTPAQEQVETASVQRDETEMRLEQVQTKDNKAEIKKVAAVKREKKNVKLKLRPVASSAAKAITTAANATIEAQVEAAKVKPTTELQQTKLKASPVEEKPAPVPLEASDQNVTSVKEPAKVLKVKRVIRSKENRRESGSELAPIATKKDSAKSSRLDSATTTTATATTTTTPKLKVKRPKKTKELPEPEPEPDLVLEANKKVSEQAKNNKVAGLTPPASPRGVKLARIRFREYNYNDFNFLTVLGHGGWGFVILAELKEHDACFAVKCIKKITIVEDDDYDSIMIERKMLALGNLHPFICKLFCTFETAGYLFFVMEYCPGGDLMFHVQHEGKFSESRCRFYAAEIICAIRFLHQRHIIYRDLKLDNILLDARGHIRLVDFGMCQCRTYREEMLPSNFCGTPEYISPEIIKGVPYNHSVDWWSFGVLLYEMAVGKMPFRGNDENELLWNVCYEQIHYPMFLTKELTSLLKLLLEREPSLRMGMATCKAGDIYEQPFFRGVDWRAVEAMRVEPPFKPEVKSNRDVSNFDSDFTESTCELSPVDESTLAKIDQAQFQQFPYTNPDLFIFDTTSAHQSSG